MDHFPIANGTSHAKLQYLQHEEFDDGTFEGYASRRGWTEDELSGENDRRGRRYGGRPMKEVDAFFQTWLFFGFLIHVFRCVHIKVTTGDFVIEEPNSAKKYLSTEKLPGFVDQWYAQVKQISGSRKWQQYDDPGEEDYDEIMEGIIARAKRVMETGHETKQYKADQKWMERKRMPNEEVIREHRWLIRNYLGTDSPVSDSVKAACGVLQFTMNKSFHDSERGNYWAEHDSARDSPAAAWMRNEFIGNGWCPSQAARFMNQLKLDGQYYLSRMRTPRYEDDHSKCEADWQRCGYKVKDWEYKTQHVRSDCTCDMVKAPSNLVKIMQDGKVPIVRYNYEDGKLEATGYDQNKNQYVAISHV